MFGDLVKLSRGILRMHIDLNADAGESFGAWALGNNEALFDFVSTVNVACGFHAGDPLTMKRTLELAKNKKVEVGAHPGYPDLVGFGRRALAATPKQVYADVLYQLGAFQGFANVAGLQVRHVKAHGALANESWKNEGTARAIAQATKDFDANLPLMVLPGTLLETQARKLKMSIVLEAFPERAYLKNAQLAPRSMEGSSIHDPSEAARRAVMMVTEKRIEAIDGGWIDLDVQSLCIHGDNPNAVEIARAVRQALEAEGIAIKNFTQKNFSQP
jgi:5-oxoprolinase (ATP-hydrolysing) subunit A